MTFIYCKITKYMLYFVRKVWNDGICISRKSFKRFKDY